MYGANMKIGDYFVVAIIRMEKSARAWKWTRAKDHYHNNVTRLKYPQHYTHIHTQFIF